MMSTHDVLQRSGAATGLIMPRDVTAQDDEREASAPSIGVGSEENPTGAAPKTTAPADGRLVADYTESEVIELAWADEVSFDAIQAQTGLSEAEVITLMRRSLRPGSFRTWRARVSGRAAKHAKVSSKKVGAKRG